jgi:hypothetical protein
MTSALERIPSVSMEMLSLRSRWSTALAKKTVLITEHRPCNLNNWSNRELVILPCRWPTIWSALPTSRLQHVRVKKSTRRQSKSGHICSWFETFIQLWCFSSHAACCCSINPRNKKVPISTETSYCPHVY